MDAARAERLWDAVGKFVARTFCAGMLMACAATSRAECPVDDHARAGCPQQVAPRAKISNTPAYDGYYVGGSSPIRGDGPSMPAEGVWGWDYFGSFYQRRIDLGWLHDRLAAKPTPTYKTDGPKLLHKD